LTLDALIVAQASSDIGAEHLKANTVAADAINWAEQKARLKGAVEQSRQWRRRHNATEGSSDQGCKKT
jgi:hypothetical protein